MNISKTFSILLLVLSLAIPVSTNGYGILSHEAIIDQTWDKSIKPLLKAKFPKSTEEELEKAHAYVYGGSIVSDIGYYPFGSHLFTNLLHYVRSGDFVNNAIAEASNVNEYGFALGLLCHYMADRYGHSLGTNRAVAVLFPKAKKKYGNTVNYEQAKVAHVRTEFGFDVIQTAKGNYVSKSYHDFIGFAIADTVLEKAFFKTYGIELKETFISFPIAAGSFRFAVGQLFPEMTKDAWKVRKSVITQLNPLADKVSYRYKIDKNNYNKEFGKPQLKSTVISFILAFIPKVGPFAGLKFKAPSEESEKFYNESFSAILDNYSAFLDKLRRGNILAENINFDTGEKTTPGEYNLADETYYKWIAKLDKNNFETVNDALKENLVSFYTDPKAARLYKQGSHKSKKISIAMRNLRSSQAGLNSDK